MRGALFPALLVPLAWFLSLAGPAFPEEPPRTLSLGDCYRMALKQSEEIALRAELITETEGRFQQALSGILPKISFSSVDKRQDGAGDSAFTRKYLPERKFTFSQPLFSGFKEFAAMRGSKSEKELRRLEKARAEQLLMVDVSDAFHLLLEQREDLRILNSIRETLRARISELESRERIGRSRPSERVAAQAQLYRVESDWELAQSRETVATQLLGFLTGLDAVGDLQGPGPALPAVQPRETYLTLAPGRPDVKAAEQALQISKQRVAAARAGFFPTVGLDGNYYVDRSGAAQDVKWDASLNVNVPIFQGGKASGAAKEAESLLHQAEIRLQQARRTALQEIRDAYAQYDGAQARVRALTQALEATEESYQMEEQEYRLSLVSNLEVLSTLQTLQDARRDLVNLLYEAYRSYWKLQAAAGEPMPSRAAPS